MAITVFAGGWYICPECNGTGEANDWVCDGCNGHGWKLIPEAAAIRNSVEDDGGGE